jgi:N-ethylmaleimide reductase
MILFEPVQLGALSLSNRIVMSPMTRDRAGDGDVPNDIMVEYYRQRASAGLIVTEGTQPTAEGKGYWRTPGIHSQQQIDGWARVAEAVHAEGGLISMQIMHCGRVVVPANRGFDADVIAPSALPCPDKVPGPDGVPAPTAMPRALADDELARVAEEHAQAARNARAAGIDAVELHCSSGYLINQFLNPASNQRTDGFGGDGAGRARFPVMVVRAMADAIGADRVGVRFSPGNPYNGMDPSDPGATFGPFIDAFSDLPLAYLHVLDMQLADFDTIGFVRDRWRGPIIVNNMLNRDSANALIESGRADATSFGRPFIANPDLVARYRDGASLAKPDFTLLYTGEERGYIDYPPLG